MKDTSAWIGTSVKKNSRSNDPRPIRVMGGDASVSPPFYLEKTCGLLAVWVFPRQCFAEKTRHGKPYRRIILSRRRGTRLRQGCRSWRGSMILRSYEGRGYPLRVSSHPLPRTVMLSGARRAKSKHLPLVSCAGASSGPRAARKAWIPRQARNDGGTCFRLERAHGMAFHP